MALHITNCFICNAKRILIRSLRYINYKPKYSQFSTSLIINKEIEKNTPVKYTTNKAAKVPISEVIGLETKKVSKLWYEKYVVIASIAALILYFCILREENDIDEILKGNKDFTNPRVELIKLKTQLQYCEKNKLPTALLKAKIEELERDQKLYYPFRF